MRKGLRITLNVILGCLLLGCIVGCIVAQYAHEETHDVTIRNITEQQHISGRSEDNGVSTYYTYIVSTDQGVFSIKPSGLFASSEFGSLKIGERYRIHTRGFSFQLLGMYPYIIYAISI